MCFPAIISRRARARLWVGLAVAALHLAVIALLVRGFAPDIVRRGSAAALAAFSLIPPPPPPATHQTTHQTAGRGGIAVIRQPSKQPLAIPSISPQLMTSAGGDDLGLGASGGGVGAGAGPGTGGTGGEGGAEKLSGEIRAADYPAESRALRIGDYVIVALTVGVDGRVRECRVHRASRDAAADVITCRLAQERFRFRPATNAAGHPVEAVFGWRQSWHF